MDFIFFHVNNLQQCNCVFICVYVCHIGDYSRGLHLPNSVEREMPG